MVAYWPDPPAPCPTGRRDDLLHHHDGTHRGTAPSANGGVLERFEAQLPIHRAEVEDLDG